MKIKTPASFLLKNPCQIIHAIYQSIDNCLLSENTKLQVGSRIFAGVIQSESQPVLENQAS